jgi:hypothetical protein
MPGKVEVLDYRNFIWRVSETVMESGEPDEALAISLPAVPADPGATAAVYPAIALFIYSVRAGLEADNPVILPPRAYLEFRPDAELIQRKDLRQMHLASPLGNRFSAIVAAMSPQERDAFQETYYLLLTCDHGPLLNAWAAVGQELTRDLQQLFRALVEPALIGLYRQYCPAYVRFLAL